MLTIIRTAENKLAAKIQFETGTTSFVDISAFEVLGEDAHKILSPIVKKLNRTSPTTQRDNMAKIHASIGRAVDQWKQTSLPKDESSWQDFIMNLFEFVLTNKASAMSLRSRMKNWNGVIAPVLELLRDEADVISLGVEIPKTVERLESVDISNYEDMVLGGHKPELATESVNKKLLGSDLLSRTDAEYLDEIRNQQAYRKRVLHDCLYQWFKQIQAHYQYGQKLIHHLDWPKLKSELASGVVVHEHMYGKKRSHLASPDTEAGLSKLLAILTYQHDGAFGTPIRRKTRNIPSVINKLPPSVPPKVSELVSVYMRINWMLGNLSSMDIAVCTAFFIMHNPMFTPYSLIMAKIRDKKGKPYLELDNNGPHFRIEKARAKAMKESTLDDLSVDVLETILQMTSVARYQCREKKDLLADYLFIQHDAGRHSFPQKNNMVRKITGSLNSNCKGQSLNDYFPQLHKAGLERGTISFTKIRATEAVLEWFRTGSIRAASKKLGNTQQVVMEHYLPKQLLIAWNTRIIRLYQNLWIVAAAASEDFLLKVTDFNSIGELNSFLTNMLFLHSQSSSPLAKELHRQFGKRLSKFNLTLKNEKSTDSRLAVSISKNTLAALYLYQETALDSGVSPKILETPDSITGLRPNQFILLAELLKSQMPSHRDPKIRESHQSALDLVSSIRQDTTWSELFIGNGRT